jgi:hypothetical protein
LVKSKELLPYSSAKAKISFSIKLFKSETFINIQTPSFLLSKLLSQQRLPLWDVVCINLIHEMSYPSTSSTIYGIPAHHYAASLSVGVILNSFFKVFLSIPINWNIPIFSVFNNLNNWSAVSITWSLLPQHLSKGLPNWQNLKPQSCKTSSGTYTIRCKLYKKVLFVFLPLLPVLHIKLMQVIFIHSFFMADFTRF